MTTIIFLIFIVNFKTGVTRFIYTSLVGRLGLFHLFSRFPASLGWVLGRGEASQHKSIKNVSIKDVSR